MVKTAKLGEVLLLGEMLEICVLGITGETLQVGLRNSELTAPLHYYYHSTQRGLTKVFSVRLGDRVQISDSLEIEFAIAKSGGISVAVQSTSQKSFLNLPEAICN